MRIWVDARGVGDYESGVRRHVDDKLEPLVARQVGRRGGDAVDERAGVERLRPHLEPPSSPLATVSMSRRWVLRSSEGAADAADQLVLGVGGGAAPHRQEVERGEDALQRGARFVADFGEEGAAGDSAFVQGRAAACSCSIARTLWMRRMSEANTGTQTSIKTYADVSDVSRRRKSLVSRRSDPTMAEPRRRSWLATRIECRF